MTDVVPPTTFLPPLKLLKTCSEKEITNTLASLRYIYLPEVRGSSRRRPYLGSHYHPIPARAAQQSNDLSAIRADAFERSFAIQWLTRFVSLFSEVGNNPSNSFRVSSQALEDAASLLAICAGVAASGTVTRTFTFPLIGRVSKPTVDNAPDSYSPSMPTNDSLISVGCANTVFEEMDDITVIIRDAPLESNDFSSVGAQTWGGSYILAEMIAESPQNFLLFSRDHTGLLQPHAPFRALELGAGTGLASLVLGKVLVRIRSMGQQCKEQSSFGSRKAPWGVDTVVASDFHLSVLANLRFNFAVNFPATSINTESHADNDGIIGQSHNLCCGPDMVVLPLDWSVIHSLAHPISAPHAGSRSCFPKMADKEASQTLAPENERPNDADTLFQSRPQTQRPALDQTDFIRDRQQLIGNNANSPTSVRPSSTSPIPPELDQPFDVIIGADIIYEHSHALWVRACIERFLRKPTRPLSQADEHIIRLDASTPPGHSYQGDPSSLRTDHRLVDALFHLIIPLRRTHAVESRSVEEVFQQAADVISSRKLSQKANLLSQSFSICDTGEHPNNLPASAEPISSDAAAVMEPIPLEVAIIGQEDILCDAYSDRETGEAVVYRYYRIGWV